MEIETYEIIVKGRVQGVCYRDFARRTANIFNVFGTAKNLVNGDVKIIAKADEISISLFLKELQKCPALARVDDIISTTITTVKNYKDFKIVY